MGQGPDARVYRVNPANGEITFGDDKRGKIPPAGRDVIRAVSYQSGGGEIGNVDAFMVTGLKSALAAVESVTNPIAASGGVDAPNVDALINTAPARIRHDGQALTPSDLEALAVSSSPEIVRARCLIPDAIDEPIRIVISRRTGERCPQPSLVEREALAKFIR